MNRKSKQNPNTAFEDLEWQVSNGKAAPTVEPEVLKVSAIKLLPEVFQHRRPATHSSQNHIKGLADAAKTRGALAPVTVWWNGKHWLCVDGHHRVAAYVMAGMRLVEVPVEVFKGAPAEALARAAETNSMDKLPMTKAEKVNAGWRLVVMGGTLSKARQALAAGISERQVAAMRATKKYLLTRDLTLESLAEMSWEVARKTHAGEDVSDWSDGETERRAQEMALAIRKAIGATAENQPEVFARAVELYSTKLAKALESWFSENSLYDDEEEFEEV